MKIFDTNHIVRMIIRDNIEQAEKAAAIISIEKVYVTYEVIAEVVYVLDKNYKLDRNRIADCIKAFLDIKNLVADNKATLVKALNYFQTTSLDFVDCMMCAYQVVEGNEVCTFDKKLNRLIKRETGSQ